MKQKYEPIKESELPILELCIQKGWRKPGQGLNDFDEDDETALDKALWFGDITPAEVKRLIMAGADPNLCYLSKQNPMDESGFYPLYWVLHGCNQLLDKEDYEIQLQIITILLEMGADPTLHEPYQNMSILEGAIFDYEITQIMLLHNDELKALWNKTDKSIKSNIDILSILAKKYHLPPVDHFYLTLKYFSTDDADG